MKALFARYEPEPSAVFKRNAPGCEAYRIALYRDLLCLERYSEFSGDMNEYLSLSGRPRSWNGYRIVWLPRTERASTTHRKRLPRASRLHYVACRRKGIPAFAAVANARDASNDSTTGLHAKTFYPVTYLTGGKPGDDCRWIERPADCGLRFLGYCDEINSSIRHSGWHCDEDGFYTMRGVIYQLPAASDGTIRVLYGYEHSYNKGTAYLRMTSEDIRLDACDPNHYAENDYRDELKWQLRKIAHDADRMAEEAAQEESQHDWEYQRGRECAELVNEMSGIRQATLNAIKKARGRKTLRASIQAAKDSVREEIESAVDELCDLRRKVKELRSYDHSECFADGYQSELARA